MCAQGLGWEQAEGLLGGPGFPALRACLQTWWGRRRESLDCPRVGVSGWAPHGPAHPAFFRQWPLQHLHLRLGAVLPQLQREGQGMRAACC